MLPQKTPAAVNESDLVMYLATGLKHIRLMALLLSFSLLFGLSFYLFSRSVYNTKTLIRVRTNQQPEDSGTIWRDSGDRVVFGMMKSAPVSKRVARRLGIKPTTSEIKRNLKSVKIFRNAEKDLVVDVYAYSFRVARDWARIMLEEYKVYRDERQLIMAESAITNYTAQLAEVSERIGENLDSKFNFEQSNAVHKVMIELNQLRDVPRSLLVVKKRLSAMDEILESVKQPGRDVVSRLALLDSLEEDPSTRLANNLPDKELSLNVGLTVPVLDADEVGASQSQAGPNIVVLPSMMNQLSAKPWEKLDRDRAGIQQQLAIKGRTFLSGHPQIVELRKQLAEIDRKLELEFEIAFNGFNVEYANLTEKKSQLEGKLATYDEVSRQHDKMLKEYRQLEAGQNLWSRYYRNLSHRRDTLDFGADKERRDFVYAGPWADLKNEPVSPRRSKALLYGLLLGLALSIGAPFLLEYLNTRISDIEHAEETLKIRGLGVVPKIIEVPFEPLMLEDASEKSDYHLKENFRLIRTNLIINSENAALPQVILVTSAMPQEGKTCVAANLALSFASKGEKTLLIDGDLRRGRVYKLFGQTNKPGLSNVLNGEIPVEQAFRVNGIENLTIMTCGKHLNSASELLDSHKFSDLMADLRGKYQRIILDTPPVLGLSETIIMQRCSDGIMLVIWSDFTPMQSVKAAVQTLQVNGGKFLGFVLNRLDFNTLVNRYKYFYYAPLYYSNYQPLPPPVAPVAHTKV